MVLDATGQELIEACQRGERDAFRALFERHKDKVYSIALRYSGDGAAAMDIAQDTFLKLFSCIGDFRGNSSFETWLYRLVVNSCFDHKRKSRRLLPLLDDLAGILRAPEASAADRMLRAEVSGQVQSAIARLAPDLRMVIILRYTEGLSYEEISEVLNCSAGTVASRLSRAHNTLERRLRYLAGKGGSGA